jgi:hypothetical protein
MHMDKPTVPIQVFVAEPNHFTHSQPGRVHDEQYGKVLRVPQDREELVDLCSRKYGRQLPVAPGPCKGEVLEPSLQHN